VVIIPKPGSYPLMSEPRQQHYIPRFYLSGFADTRILKREGQEVIWVYEKGKEPRRSSPIKEARRRDFYSFEQDGIRRGEAEKWLGDLEDQVAPIITTLVNERRDLTETEKSWLALFAGIMQTRTPAGRRLSENRIDPFVNKIMKEKAADPSAFREFLEETFDPMYMPGFDIDNPQQVEQLRQEILSGKSEEISKDPQFELASMIEVGKKVGSVLFEMNWQIIYNESDDLFLTSDDPVVSWRMDVEANRLYLREGVDRPNANVWLPLCREICLRMNKECDPRHKIWDDSSVRYINKTMVWTADRWIFAPTRSERLKRLVDKKGGRANVDALDLRFEGQRY